MSEEQVARRAALERELRANNSVDVELALLALGDGEPGATTDAPAEVGALRAARPHLFAARTPTPGAMGAQPPEGERARRDMTELVNRARATGDRAMLLRYLRARRNG